MKIENYDITLIKEDELYSVIFEDHIWKPYKAIEPKIIMANGEELLFKDHLKEETIRDLGVNKGILSHYVFSDKLIVETFVYISFEGIFFKLLPIVDEALIKEIIWPSYFKSEDPKGYSSLPIMQGVYLPNTYDFNFDHLDFDGQFLSHDAYLSMYHQYEKGQGYCLINLTPFDCKYKVIHQGDKAFTAIGLRWLESLAKIGYERRARFTFEKDMDYVRAAKIYRHFVKETGHFKSLREKAIALPSIKKLIGASLVHFGIKTHTDETSTFYSEATKDDILHTFKERLDELKALKEIHKDRLYVHLDGWGEPGYDNCHPDYLPICKAAGGNEGLRELSQYLYESGDLFALHDQYRDYYLKAPSYNIDNALKEADGSVYEHRRWAGGRQNYLCANLALDYVKRNFNELFKADIKLTASYLDVFTCNEMDECYDPRHPMTRFQCAQFRKACFHYLISKGIIPSSEECTDWAADTLVLCHYGPYEFMLKEKGAKRMGLAIPLFDLVYHDALILPWITDEADEDYLLYALMNGGMPYIIRDGAYPDVDGAFGSTFSLEERSKRAKIVNDLHRKVAYSELLDHRLLSADGKVMESTFEGGIKVSVDLTKGSYKITSLSSKD